MAHHPLPDPKHSPEEGTKGVVIEMPGHRPAQGHGEGYGGHHRASNHMDDHDDEHLDERWLVSYSDMMTLLFGLFVMLYTLAMEHKGEINQALSQIRQQDQTQKAQAGQSPEEFKQLIAQLEQKVQELERRLAQADLARAELDQLTANHQNVTQQLQSAMAQVESLTQASAGAKNAAAVVADLEKTKRELQQKSQRLVQVEKDLENLQVQQAQLHAQLQAQAKAQVGLKGEAQLLAQQQRRVAELEQENTSVKAQLLAATKKLEMQAAKPALTGSFLLLILSWTTEKHDLDMVVTDPQGRSFSFENRTYEKAPGEFIIDSRTGPGIEVFQAPNPVAGQYELKVDFYNAYGNKADAEVKVSVMTRFGEKKLNTFTLNRAGNKTKAFKFTVNAQGAVEGI